MKPITKAEIEMIPACCRLCGAKGYCGPLKGILKEVRKTLREQTEMFAPCSGIRQRAPNHHD